MTKKAVSTTIELLPISEVVGAHYNPRDTVRERLDHLCASLQHLGFLMPLYMNKTGVLLSGHQRTKAAIELGYTHVPIVRVDIPQNEEKGVNIAFNRCTNDMEGAVTGQQAFELFQNSLTDMELDKYDPLPPDSFTCLNKREVGIQDYLDPALVVRDANQIANAKLIAKKVFIPVVISGGRVVNGRHRLAALWSYGYTHCEVVEVPEHLASYADLTLNLLSMDFNFQEFLADELRFNAYRRRSVDNQFVGFSRGWSYPVFKRTVRASSGDQTVEGRLEHPDFKLLPHLDDEVRKKYLDTYGKCIVEIGAGTLRDHKLAVNGGLTVYSFEPYHLIPVEQVGVIGENGKTKRTEVDVALSKSMASKWLDDILEVAESGRRVSAVVSSYMLNSIPHHKDRMACLAIMAALCGVKGKAFVSTQSVMVKKRLGGSTANSLNPNMEPNMVLGTSLNAFKTQKYFYKDELGKMFETFFTQVEVVEDDGTLYVTAAKAKRVPPQILKEALELEFELPYADGTRMGMSEKAKQVFGRYCGYKIE
jgi:ParB-like chromosome segregation protein Spo0J